MFRTSKLIYLHFIKDLFILRVSVTERASERQKSFTLFPGWPKMTRAESDQSQELHVSLLLVLGAQALGPS